jgi:hypothetical protein
MNGTIACLTALPAMLAAAPGAAYDAELARSYAALFAPCQAPTRARPWPAGAVCRAWMATSSRPCA